MPIVAQDTVVLMESVLGQQQTSNFLFERSEHDLFAIV